MSLKAKRKRNMGIMIICLILIAIVFIYPVYLMFMNSFKPFGEIVADVLAFPKDVLEAAVVDGANSRQSFFKVTLPLLGPSFTTCIFMSLTNGLKVFDIILALTKGGPGTASNSVTLQIYKEAFTNNNYGLGSAESIIYFLFVLVVTQLVLKGFSRKEVEI
jgi:raffinose/stachyose/melibiose transport system permease protein